jgi:hypothetical protein
VTRAQPVDPDGAAPVEGDQPEPGDQAAAIEAVEATNPPSAPGGPAATDFPVPDAPAPDPPAPDPPATVGRPQGAPGRRRLRLSAVRSGVHELLEAIREGDEAMVERAVVGISQSRRWLAPLGLAVGAFVMLFQGLKLVVSNVRLLVIEVLPAAWIWLAMLDLKAHALRGRSFHVVHGVVLAAVFAAIVALTALSFYLNAIFAFAVARQGPADVSAGFAQARVHRRPVLLWGGGTGIALAVATTIFPRWSHWWFVLSLSAVIGVMMFAYVALPARLVGVRPAANASRRDKIGATAVGGALGALVCAPPYLLGRLGILLLGSRTTFVFGVILLVIGFTLEAGATGAVKAIKMSAKLAAGQPIEASTDRQPDEPPGA